MSYKKKFINKSGMSSPISGANSNSGAWNNRDQNSGYSNTDLGYKNYMSRLPEVYTGHPNRIERYQQYDMMDVDAEINACLDIIAEFSTQRNEHNKTPFSFEFKEEPTPHEVDLLTKQLQQWCKLNEFDVRMFKIFRNVVKYGDQVFVRDPENFKLYWVDMVKLIKVIVNESEGKSPEQYVIKDININLQNLSVAQKTNTDFAANPATGLGGSGGGSNTSYTVPAMPYNTTGSRFTLGQSEAAVDSKHVLHLSLTEGLDRFWPFGQSILENIFKVYKQKELLEDAVLIYRVQRAPERRMFKIDVGNMPSHLAMAFVERVKNEIHQRRIPSLYGGQCFTMETRVRLLDGRTLSIADLASEHAAGKKNWVYSCDPETGNIVPAPITWAGPTRKNARVLKLTLDSGETITCTPDHKFPILNKGFVEAKDLVIGESFIAGHTRHEPLYDNNKYLQIFDPSEKKWKFTHRLVAEYFRNRNEHRELIYSDRYTNSTRTTVHHLDVDKLNNNPENLVWMNHHDHFAYHTELNSKRRVVITAECYRYFIDHIGLQPNNPNLTFKQTIAYFSHTDGTLLDLIKKSNDPGSMASKLKTLSQKILTKIVNYGGFATYREFVEVYMSQQGRQRDWTIYKFDDEIFDLFKQATFTSDVALPELIAQLNADDSFMRKFSELQSPVTQCRLTKNYITALLAAYGYDNYRHYCKEHNLLTVRRPAKIVTKYKVDGKVLPLLKRTYNELNTKLYHTQRYVGSDRVWQKLRADEEFIDLIKDANPGMRKGRYGKAMFNHVLSSLGFYSYGDFVEKFPYLNHTLIKVEEVETLHDTGTITVDGSEQYTNYHTFLLDAGVFTKNSVVDASYNPLCLDLETKIPLLDGRTLPLRNIISEFEEGKENWAYSCDPETGKVVPGVINWAGVTRKNTEVLELTFDNGNTLVCTPDHKIPVFGKGFVEAKDLTTEDELITHATEGQSTWDHSLSAYVDTADLVGGFFNSLGKHQEFTFLQEAITQHKDLIVHKDGYYTNNNPDNLMFVNSTDYHLYLQVGREDFWTTETSLSYSIDESTVKDWANLTTERRLTLFWCAKYGLSTEELHNDPGAKGRYLAEVQKIKETTTLTTEFAPVTTPGEVIKTRLVSITPHTNIDTGTITIDGLHRWHDYHTFAIDSGIFVKNSMNEDYFFPVTCLTLDTPIPLLDGRTLTLQELIDEHAVGKQNWVYSVNQTTFVMEPGKIVWAGVTRKDATLVEVELDNGEKVRVTPDHRFIMRDGTEVEAQHLIAGDSLMPLYLKEAKTSPNQKGKPYLRYVDNATGKVKWVHTTVLPKAHSGKDSVIHHIDYDSRNNNPTNLVEMLNEDHIELHRRAGTYSLEKQWNCPESREKLITGIRNYHANRTDEDTDLIRARNSRNAISGHDNMSEATRLARREKLTAARLKQDLKLEYSTEMVEYVRTYAVTNKESIHSLDDLRRALEADTAFMSLWRSANENRLGKNKTIDISASMFSEVRIRELFALTEYQSWHNFSKAIGIDFARFSFSELNKTNYAVRVQEYSKSPTTCKQCGAEFEYVRRNRKFCDTSCSTRYNNLNGVLGAQVNANKSKYHNHKVKAVTWLATREDTGDITVEGNHNFAVAAGVYIHNSDGRGSSVEVLPGGSNLGEIDDLRYFNNRLARGLRVPSSYLPTGPDDSQTPLSDGRVGTAMIQEFRFNQYCERLQNYICLKLDEEFKLFLRWRGFNIDTGLFNIVFNPPQNFAAYRQSELDTARVSTFTAMEAMPYIAKRFALERFLGLSEEEIKKNEKLWEQENAEDVQDEAKGSDLRNIGVSTCDFTADQEISDEIADNTESTEEGPEVAGPVGGGAGESPPGGAGGPVGGSPMQI